MALDPIGNELLYVPFSNECEVDQKNKVSPTTDAFFSEDGCFVRSDFKENIERIKQLPGIEGDEAYSISQENLIVQVDNIIKSEMRFKKWIEDSGEGIFCLLGDIGTGKTTYLHSLAYEYTGFIWKIKDIRRFARCIRMPGNNIDFPEESIDMLHGKIISVLINDITDYLFPIDEKIDTDYSFPIVEKINWNFRKGRENIRNLLQFYKNHIAKLAPLKEYEELYKQLEGVPNSDKDETYSYNCAKILAKYLNKKCLLPLSKAEGNERSALACALGHYLIYLLNLLYDKHNETNTDEKEIVNRAKKAIIVFDNIERFIGDEETFFVETSKFIDHLREIVDSYGQRYTEANSINKFADRFQFIISMRNTTVKNYIPLQNADFLDHTLDLSNWFPVSKSIYKWHQRNSIYTSMKDYQK